jgi:hypothetical protein
VWANYTGTGGGGSNLTVHNPNPADGITIYGTNYIARQSGGLATSVDVVSRNFTTPPATIPGIYSLMVESDYRTNGNNVWNSSDTYNKAYDNNSGTPTTGPLYIGQYEMAGEYVVMRAFLMFDTSAIPNEATINSAYVRLTGFDDHSDDDEFAVTIQQVKPPAPHDPLIPGDYDRHIFAGNFGNRNTTSFVNDKFFNISLNASGLLDINLSGYTYWMVRSSEDIAARDPGVGNDEWVVFYAPGGVNPDYRPYLIINYTVPGSNWAYIVNLTASSNSSGSWLNYSTLQANSNGTWTFPINSNFSSSSMKYFWSVNYTDYAGTIYYVPLTFTTGIISLSGGPTTYKHEDQIEWFYPGFISGMILVPIAFEGMFKKYKKRREEA